TPASVACADSTTATSSVKGLRCSNSPFGSGLAFLKRSNASRTSASVQGFAFLAAGTAFAAFLLPPDFAGAVVRFDFGFDLGFDLATVRRVIFGMGLASRF